MEQGGKKSFWPDFGTLALAVMIMGIVVSRSTAYALKGVESRSLAVAGLCVFFGSELAAVVLGILALCGVGRKEGRTDVWRAIVAIVFGGLILFCVPVGMWTMHQVAEVRKRAAEERRRKELEELEQIEQQSQDSILDFAGWVGSAEVLEATIVVTSLPDQSPMSKQLNSYWAKDVSLVSLGIQMTGERGEVSLDPSSARLVLPGGSQQSCIPTVEVYRTARKDKEDWLAKFSGNIRVGPGEAMASGWAFFPRGTDLSGVESFIVTVNDEDVVVQGAFFTSDRKKELFSLGQEMQRAVDQ